MRAHVKTALTAILVSGAMFSLTGTVHAAPAEPGARTLTQADGSEIRARAWGDEWMHGWETLDGYSIIFDETTRNWTYAVPESEGSLLASKDIVGRDSPPGDVAPHIRPSGNALVRSQKRRASVLQRSDKNLAPVTGTGKIITLMVNFTDTATTYSAANFSNLFFGSSGRTMANHYKEMSHNLFTVAGAVKSWVTASHPHNYYGQNDFYGNDAYPATLVIEAVRAADASVNFAPYDLDGDCYVDVVSVIHQGTGEESGCGASSDIWSHSWSLNSAEYWGDGTGEVTTNDRCPAGGFIKLDEYVIQPEKYCSGMMTVGVFSHEYGHAIGLPDLYDTDNSSEGIGNWCLMASGPWNSTGIPGDTPAHMSAWCKYKLGWVTPTSVRGKLTSEPIKAASTAADVYQLLAGSPSSGTGEYFLVENREKTGFDAGLDGSGLAIWHIDESKGSNTQECYPPSNCESNHYKVSLEQADGHWDLENNNNRGDSGDLYPGASGKTVFGPTSTPNSKLYNGTSSGATVTSISSAAATMTATLQAPAWPPTVATTSASSVGRTTATLEGTVTPNGASTTASFQYGLLTSYGSTADFGSVGGGASAVAINKAIAGLTCGTNYHFRAMATNAEGTAYGSDATFTTTACLPTVISFQINNGAASTSSRSVRLNNTASGSPTQYMASESSSFSGASWQTYATTPTFMLSAGDGTRTIYFKVKNTAGESVSASDTIILGELSSFWEGAVDLGGGWRYLDWLGFFNVTSDPWIYHEQLDWMYVSGTSASDLWTYYPKMDAWLWTSNVTFPWLYRSTGPSPSWLYYLEWTTGPAWFHNQTTDVWEAY